MYPHARAFVEEMKNQPFALIGVNSDDLARAVKAVEENGLNWRSFQNESEGATESISGRWGVSGWPTLVVLDRDRVIHYRGHDGDEAMATARKLVAQLQVGK